MRGVPDLDMAVGDEGVSGDEPSGPTDLDATGVHRSADLNALAQHLGRHGVAGSVDGDERHDVVHTAGLDVVGVEPVDGQRRQERPLGHGPVGGADAGRSRLDRMHVRVQPHRGAPVELIERSRYAVGFELRQQGGLELTERPLDLALALRVTGLARGDLGSVMRRERDRRRMQHEPAALR